MNDVEKYSQNVRVDLVDGLGRGLALLKDPGKDDKPLPFALTETDNRITCPLYVGPPTVLSIWTAENG